MAASDAASPVALLRRAVLLAGILPVIAGFLGMHILSGSHGLHPRAPHSGAGHAAADQPAVAPPADLHGDHANHDAGLPASTGVTEATDTAVTTASVTAGGTQVPPSCVCQGGCAGKPAVHPDCTPSPAGPTLSAPQPGTTLLAMQPWPAALAVRAAGYAYMPGSRTPGELSISRT